MSLIIIQVDICPEEMGNNASESIMLVGDIKAVVTQVCIIIHKNNEFWPSILYNMYYVYFYS